MSLAIPSASDVVFIDTLQVAANIGVDCWGKKRPQPLGITVYLHLRPSFLNKSGETDDVADSVHYGHLTKVISKLIKSRSENEEDGFDGIDGLVAEVASEAAKLAGDAVEEARVVVDAPKLILLAGNFSFDTALSTKSTPDSRPGVVSKRVSITDLSLPVLIGVNPPERLAKQRVVVDLIFYERNDKSAISHVAYQSILDGLIKDMEQSEYLTLEKFVMQVVRSACLTSPSFEAVTVRAQKPSALSFARFSGVEITRRRSEFA